MTTQASNKTSGLCCNCCCYTYYSEFIGHYGDVMDVHTATGAHDISLSDIDAHDLVSCRLFLISVYWDFYASAEIRH